MKTTKTKLRGSLKDSAFVRYVTFSILYVAQGIPEGVIMFAIPAWLAMNGKSAIEISGIVAIAILPWSFKFLVAPFFDRYTIITMGRKRPWVIFGQLGLIVSFLSFAFIPDPLHNITGLMVSSFFVGLFGACQDVATDGMAIDVIPEKEQARANGLMWGCKTVGISLSLLIGTLLINKFGFTTAISLLSMVVALIILFPIFIRERPGEKVLPWTSGEASIASRQSQVTNWKRIFRNILKAILLPSSMILIVASFTTGIIFGIMDAFFPIFTVQQLHWDNAQFSEIFSVINIIAGLSGLVVGGILVDRFGKLRTVSLFLISMAVLLVSFPLFKEVWEADWIINAFILTYYITYVFLTIATFAIAMQLCWKTVAATQFTLFMAICNLGRSMGASQLGHLKEWLGWSGVLIAMACIAFLSLVLMRYIRFEKHKSKITEFNRQAMAIE